MTAGLLVVALISLEQRSPIQSASDESPMEKPASPAAEVPTDPSPLLSGKEKRPPVVPETFTFYDTLPEPDPLDPVFVDLTPEPEGPPSIRPAAPAEPIAVPKKKTPRRYTIQVAANKDQSFSATLAERLKRKGYHAYVVRHDSPDRGTWYRVRVGHFQDRKTAEEMARRLSSRERLKTFIAFGAEPHKP